MYAKSNKMKKEKKAQNECSSPWFHMKTTNRRKFSPKAILSENNGLKEIAKSGKGCSEQKNHL
jgi:hypothetical protein